MGDGRRRKGEATQIRSNLPLSDFSFPE